MLTNYKGKFGLRYNKILNSLVTQPNSGVISRFIYRTEIHKKKTKQSLHGNSPDDISY